MTQRKMKDSGVVWIGQVPEGWKVTRLKYVSKLDPEIKPLGLSTDDIVSFAPMECIRFDCRVGKESPLSRDNGSYSSFQNGDIAMAKVTPCFENGNICNMENLKNGYCFGSSELYCIRADGMARKYLFYVLANPGFIAGGVASMTGMGGLKRVTSLYMRSQFIPMPDVPEQRKIAAFLDGECGKIDVLRGKVEKQIAALEEYRKSVITEAVTKGVKRGRKMKVADVAWVVTAPQEWERTRLKLLCDRDITYGIVKLGDPDEDGVKVLRCSDVLAGRIAEGEIRTVTKSLSQEYSRTILRGGEVVVNVRGTLGGCAVVPEKMRGYNIAREVAMVAVKGNAADARFIMYQLLSSSFDSYIKMQLSGAVYVGLNIEMLGKYSFFCPDLSEQREIAAYLDRKCAAIDSMVGKCREELDRLAEYKKSLIYEYVTGKKEVA